MRSKWVAVILAFTAASFASSSVHAASATFADQCPTIEACAKAVSELTGQKYVFAEGVKGKLDSTSNLYLTRENAELLFTNLLHLTGYSRVPLGEKDAFRIIPERDARDTNLPTVTADSRNAPSLPENWDLYTMEYKASHPESTETIARTLRSFMSATSRIVPAELSGLLMVTAPALELKRVYALIRDNDQKMSPEMKKREEKREEERMKAIKKPSAE
jgi:hypothetical protein